jgi:hypothetical protein
VDTSKEAVVFDDSVDNLRVSEKACMPEAGRDDMGEIVRDERGDGPVSSRGTDKQEDDSLTEVLEGDWQVSVEDEGGSSNENDAEGQDKRDRVDSGQATNRDNEKSPPTTHLNAAALKEHLNAAAVKEPTSQEAVATAWSQPTTSSGSPTKKAKGTSKQACNLNVVHAAELVPERSDLVAADQVSDVTDAELQKMDYRSLLSLGHQVMVALSRLHVQTHIDGMNNIWIVKPAALSRGRGIRLFNNLDKLFAYIKGKAPVLLRGKILSTVEH